MMFSRSLSGLRELKMEVVVQKEEKREKGERYSAAFTYPLEVDRQLSDIMWAEQR